jgi:hypothetical protein
MLSGLIMVKSGIRSKKRLLYDDEQVVLEYFRLIQEKDIEQLMDLFVPDAVIYEPFSKLTGGLRGRSAIESFFRVVIMANDSLQYHLIIEKKSYLGIHRIDSENNNKNTANNSKVITVLVTFQRGDSVRARFTFEFSTDYSHNNVADIFSSRHNRIKALHIEFIK